MQDTQTPNVEATTTPVSDKAPMTRKPAKARLAVVRYAMNAQLPAIPPRILRGLEVQRQGEEYLDRKGNKRTRTTSRVRQRTLKEMELLFPKLSVTERQSIIDAAGTWIKPKVMGEINEAGADSAFAVQSYSKKQSKYDELAVRLRRINVQDEVTKFCLKYNLKPEVVRRRLHLKEPATIAA